MNPFRPKEARFYLDGPAPSSPDPSKQHIRKSIGSPDDPQKKQRERYYKNLLLTAEQEILRLEEIKKQIAVAKEQGISFTDLENEYREIDELNQVHTKELETLETEESSS